VIVAGAAVIVVTAVADVLAAAIDPRARSSLRVSGHAERA
jgi:ABC-type dipeptide/oligopeptide/nickel transport system permease component